MRLYAHRGSPGSTSYENTVPAVAASLAAGADGVEVDLRLSSDGVLVASHDADLRRLAASPLLVPTTRWDGLRVACELRGVPLARAEWMLAAVAGRPVILELKHPMPGMVPRTTAALVEMLSSLAAAGLPLDVTVSSFSPALVAAVRSSTPAALGVRTALLGRVVDRPSALLRRTLDAGHDEMHPHVVTLLGEPSALRARARARSDGRALDGQSRPRPAPPSRARRRCHDHGRTGQCTARPGCSPSAGPLSRYAEARRDRHWCTRAGRYVPTERLDAVRERFFPGRRFYGGGR